jgi:4-hydroxy-2-oxoheptanedioate aldolase
MTAAELRRRWREGGPAYGAWLTIPNPLSVELVALAGFDWVCVDLQHGLGGLEGLAPILQAVSGTGVTPLVRVPGNETWLIGRALDLGAAGVIVPLVESSEETARAVRACRYPPDGSRSYGPVRTAGTGDDPLCVVMCETQEGVEHLADISRVSGVDGVYIGPRDLALSYGLDPGPKLDALVVRILATCREHGVPAGIQARSGPAARAYTEQGFAFAAVATDRDLLARASRDELAAALGRDPRPDPPMPGLLRASASYV